MSKKQQLEQVAVGALIPYARNARKHSDEQVAQIAASIREFGFNAPVLVDADNGIIAGHGRVLAARKLGLAEVPCLRLKHLTDAQRRAYILADNRLAELGGGWDEEMLKVEFEQLTETDFDINLTGFDSTEVENLLNQIDSTANTENGKNPLEKLDKYLESETKVISISYESDEFISTVNRLDRIMKQHGFSSYSPLLVMLIDFYEANRNN
jgi:ParB-like chromosome segregation protein Spo0J